MNKNDRQTRSGRTTPQPGQDSRSARPTAARDANNPATQNGKQSPRYNSDKRSPASPNSKQATSSQSNPKTKTSRTQQQKKPVSNITKPGTNSPARQASPNRSYPKSNKQENQVTSGADTNRGGNSTTLRRDTTNQPIPNKNSVKVSSHKAAASKQGPEGGIGTIAAPRDAKKTRKSQAARKNVTRDDQSTNSAKSNNTQIKKQINSKHTDRDNKSIDSDDINNGALAAEEVSSEKEIDNIDNEGDEQPRKKRISEIRKKVRVNKPPKKYLPKKASNDSVGQVTENELTRTQIITAVAVANLVMIAVALAIFVTKPDCISSNAEFGIQVEPGGESTTSTASSRVPVTTATEFVGAELPEELITVGPSKPCSFSSEPYDSSIDETYMTSYSCGVPATEPDLLRGNGQAVLTSWPYTFQVISYGTFRGYQPECVGALISPRHVLTASQCFFDDVGFSKSYAVVGGLNVTSEYIGTQIQLVHKIRIHPKSNMCAGHPVTVYDFALLSLQEQYDSLNNFVRLACLPDVKEALPAGTRCWTTGWGPPSANTRIPLKQVSVEIVSERVCRRDLYKDTSMSSTVCGRTSPSDSSCLGQTGSPLFCYTDGAWTLYGITSFGQSACASSDLLPAFGTVSYVVDWICCFARNLPMCSGELAANCVLNNL